MMTTSNNCWYSQAQLYHYHFHHQQASLTGIGARSFLKCSTNTRQYAASAATVANRIVVADDVHYYSCCCCNKQSNINSMSNRHRFAVRATETDEQKQEEEEEKYEEYEVEIERPFGLKFAKGRDGATYIDTIASGLNADKTGKFTVGDKVIATSAMFGTEIWPAAEYERTMYTIRQRIGPLYMKMQKRFGNLDYTVEMSEKEIIRAERNAGFISDRIREIQVQNYQRKMEQKQRRERDLREGLQLYKLEKYDEAREKFESVLGSRPTPNEASVTNYNVACCYSKPSSR